MNESSERAMNVPVVAVVLAAGFGTRFDPNNPKQLVSVAGKPIVCWSIEAFERNPRVTDIIVVVNATVRAHVEQLADEHGYPKVRAIVDGGAERADSTLAALAMLGAAGIPADAKLLIHDAVRPFVEQSSIDGCIDALDEFDAATVAIASTDTILLTRDVDAADIAGAARAVKTADIDAADTADVTTATVDTANAEPTGSAVDAADAADTADAETTGSVAKTTGVRKVIRAVPERPDSFRAQTPQAFRFDTIRRAYELAAADPDFHPTDDTRVVVDYLPDTPVAIVPGSETNLKITTQADLPTAERIAEARNGSGVTPMTKEEARARMHAVLGMAAGQLHG